MASLSRKLQTFREENEAMSRRFNESKLIQEKLVAVSDFGSMQVINSYQNPYTLASLFIGSRPYRFSFERRPAIASES